MKSTFFGLEIARRGMMTQQTALQTVSHNIANANTPGYSRQRVNFVQTEPYPAASLNRPQIPGQMGTGVEAGSIERVRDHFLDVQYRGENNKLGYWQTKQEALKKMEEIMNEPSESGLSQTMDLFWQSLQDLAVNPMNPGARSVVRQRGIAVAETFNYLSSSLNGVRQDLKNEIEVTEKQINSLLQQIHQINNQISDVEPHGYLPNDLYDERDRLLDELSQLVNIQVSYEKNGGNSKAIAEGKAIVKLVADGMPGDTLVDALGYNKVTINFSGSSDTVNEISVGSTVIRADNFTYSGKLRGLIDSYGFEDGSGNVKGIYPNMLAELDSLAYTFAVRFNEQHEDGKSPNVIDGTSTSVPPFFKDKENGTIDGTTPKEGFAGRMAIADEILTDLNNIANADASNPVHGDAQNIIKLANIIVSEKLNYGTYPSTFKDYYESVIGDMAVQSQEAVRLSSNSNVLREAVEQRRMSMSSVSLDEEMTNMIQFQHAYNAAARMITLQDELLDRIINGMGTVGR
jgi:flagellar hook-associated protein 1